MFRLATSPTFWSTVRLEHTLEDGRRVKGDIEVRYKRKTLEEVREFITTEKMDVDIAREVVDGWRKVEGEDGNELPFSLEELEKALAHGYGGPIATTFMGNYPRAREKN